MSSILPTTVDADPAALRRGTEDTAGPARVPQDLPPVLPAAVILPRAAAWLNPGNTAYPAPTSPGRFEQLA